MIELELYFVRVVSCFEYLSDQFCLSYESSEQPRGQRSLHLGASPGYSEATVDLQDCYHGSSTDPAR